MNSTLTDTNVTIARLQAFAEVAQAGSIAAATKLRATKQSQYSKQIGELEKGLGITLFNRSRSGMTLSFNGQQLAGIVTAFLDAIEDLVNEQSTANRLIRIGAGNSVYQWMLLPIAKDLRTRLPLVSLEFHNLRSRDIIERLQKGEVDIGIVRKQDRPDTNRLKSKPLKKTLRFALFYKSESYQKPTLKKLLSSGRMIGLNGGGVIWRKTRELMESQNLEPHLWMRFDSMPMVSNALKQSDGVALLPLEAMQELATFGYETLHHQTLNTFDRTYALHYNSRVAEMRNPIKKAAEKIASLLA